MLPIRETVLFVCVENSCRSQIAEAFGKILGEGLIDVFSCGSRPSGFVNDKAILSMKAIGYDLASHKSQALNEMPRIEYDLVVTMGCGDACPRVQAKKREDWEIPDPKHLEMDPFNEVRDLIKKKVIHLIETIKSSQEACERQGVMGKE